MNTPTSHKLSSDDSSDLALEFQIYLNSDEEMDFLKNCESTKNKANDDDQLPLKIVPEPIKVPIFRALSRAHLELIQEEDSFQGDHNFDDTLFNSRHCPNNNSKSMGTAEITAKLNAEHGQMSPNFLKSKNESGFPCGPPEKTTPKHPISEFLDKIEMEDTLLANKTAKIGEDRTKRTDPNSSNRKKNISTEFGRGSNHELIDQKMSGIRSSRDKRFNFHSEKVFDLRSKKRNSGSGNPLRSPHIRLTSMSEHPEPTLEDSRSRDRHRRGRIDQPHFKVYTSPGLGDNDSFGQAPIGRIKNFHGGLANINSQTSLVCSSPGAPAEPKDDQLYFKCFIKDAPAVKPIKQLNISKDIRNSKQLAPVAVQPDPVVYNSNSKFKQDSKSFENLMNRSKLAGPQQSGTKQPNSTSFLQTSQNPIHSRPALKLTPQQLIFSRTEKRPKNMQTSNKKINNICKDSKLHQTLPIGFRNGGITSHEINTFATQTNFDTQTNFHPQKNPGKENRESMNLEPLKLNFKDGSCKKSARAKSPLFGSFVQQNSNQQGSDSKKEGLVAFSSHKFDKEGGSQISVFGAKMGASRLDTASQLSKWSKSPMRLQSRAECVQGHVEAIMAKRIRDFQSPFLNKVGH